MNKYVVLKTGKCLNFCFDQKNKWFVVTDIKPSATNYGIKYFDLHESENGLSIWANDDKFLANCTKRRAKHNYKGR